MFDFAYILLFLAAAIVVAMAIYPAIERNRKYRFDLQQTKRWERFCANVEEIRRDFK